jgi:hypothetical protein
MAAQKNAPASRRSNWAEVKMGRGETRTIELDSQIKSPLTSGMRRLVRRKKWGPPSGAMAAPRVMPLVGTLREEGQRHTFNSQAPVRVPLYASGRRPSRCNQAYDPTCTSSAKAYDLNLFWYVFFKFSARGQFLHSMGPNQV